MMCIGICGSIGFFILRIYSNPSDKNKVIIGLIVSIVSFISFILFSIYLNSKEGKDNTLDEKDCDFSDEPFVKADIVFLFLSLPITGATTAIILLYCYLMSDENKV